MQTSSDSPALPTAAILVIGDEILSGRTQDINIQTIAKFLEPFGIPVMEVRIVPDVEAKIVDAVQTLSGEYTFLFTTGGIGPTHDDITADSVAKAFNLAIAEDPEAVRLLLGRYGEDNFTAARRRMARVPDGASLIRNPVSVAPGFQIRNVFVMAGVPNIMRGMLEDVGTRLPHVTPVLSVSVGGDGLREGNIAGPLGDLAKSMPEVSFGSYPWFGPDGYGAMLVARGRDADKLEAARLALVELVTAQGVVVKFA